MSLRVPVDQFSQNKFIYSNHRAAGEIFLRSQEKSLGVAGNFFMDGLDDFRNIHGNLREEGKSL